MKHLKSEQALSVKLNHLGTLSRSQTRALDDHGDCDSDLDDAQTGNWHRRGPGNFFFLSFKFKFLGDEDPTQLLDYLRLGVRTQLTW